AASSTLTDSGLFFSRARWPKWTLTASSSWLIRGRRAWSPASKQALRCDDTSRDLRVDAEVCRQLGLRSLAVVPLRRRRGVAGVLEVFSAQPHVFTDRHMDLLGQLAEMAETVSAGHRNRGNRAGLMIVG